MRKRFFIKLGLSIITLIALILFNLDLGRRGKSEEQVAYERWLSAFEEGERSSQGSKYRLVEISAETSAQAPQKFSWSVSGLHSDYVKIERLLELLKEANTLTWGIPESNAAPIAPEGHGIIVHLVAADYSMKVFAPSGNIGNNIAFQNFLKLMQLEAQRLSSRN